MASFSPQGLGGLYDTSLRAAPHLVRNLSNRKRQVSASRSETLAIDLKVFSAFYSENSVLPVILSTQGKVGYVVIQVPSGKAQPQPASGKTRSSPFSASLKSE